MTQTPNLDDKQQVEAFTGLKQECLTLRNHQRSQLPPDSSKTELKPQVIAEIRAECIVYKFRSIIAIRKQRHSTGKKI